MPVFNAKKNEIRDSAQISGTQTNGRYHFSQYFNWFLVILILRQESHEENVYSQNKQPFIRSNL